MSSAQPRLIFNDDGSNFLYSWDDLGPGDLQAYLRRLAGTQVDLVAYCVAFGGYVAYYDSAIADPLGTGFAVGTDVKARRAARNRRRLEADGTDYLGLVFSTLAEMGLPSLASLRLNDAHMSSDPVGPVAGRFWMNHPEWRLGEPYAYYGSCLNYAVPAVREYLRLLILEVLERYPAIAGIELDAMRSPFFFPDGQGEACAPIFTEFVHQIRADLDTAAARQGRERYQLWATVPRTPQLALESGLDVTAWDAAGLVDGLAPGCYNTDFQPPIEAWKDALSPRTTVPAYVNCSPATARYLSREEYRGVAANAWGAGADGVYLFNFPCLDELSFLLPRDPDERPFPTTPFAGYNWHPDLEQSRLALQEVGDPATLRGRDKHYLFYLEPPTYRHHVPEAATMDRLQPAPLDLVFRCYDEGTTSARLEIKAVEVTLGDEFAFALNGQPLTPEQTTRLYSASGRDARLHPQRLGPYSLYSWQLPAEALRVGENRLTVNLVRGTEGLLGKVQFRELELTVEYSEEAGCGG